MKAELFFQFMSFHNRRGYNELPEHGRCKKKKKKKKKKKILKEKYLIFIKKFFKDVLGVIKKF
jgi:hypothetical protein